MTGEDRVGWYVLGFAGVAVPTRGRANINVQPRLPFIPTLLRVDPESSPYFSVESVSVGRVVLTRGPAPATDFAGEGRLLDPTPLAGPGGPLDRSVRVSPSRFVTISVLNTGDSPRVFTASVSGPPTDWEPGEEQLFNEGE